MKTPTAVSRGCMVCIIWLWASAWGMLLYADMWGYPTKITVVSENKRFMVEMTPPKPLVAHVSEIQNGVTNEIWRTTLGNEVSPLAIVVSDDGSNLITFDNWGKAGYGDDVVAIYGRQGRLARYSLEQLAPPPYLGKFDSSFTSRFWRRNCLQFFLDRGKQKLFCMWLDWDHRWLAWQMEDGKLINVKAEDIRCFNEEGRNRALSAAITGKIETADLVFLSRLRFKEDRQFIESWLQDTSFYVGCIESPGRDVFGGTMRKPEPSFRFTARSQKRRIADTIISIWDGLSPKQVMRFFNDEYHFLGTLEGAVTFARAPKKNEGVIRLYLIAANTPLNQWANSQPSQYLVAGLYYYYPHDPAIGSFQHGQLDKTVHFHIYSLTPGNYRLKAVWETASRYVEKPEINYKPKQGDYESVTSPEIQIEKGKVTKGIQIDCLSLVGS